MILGLFLLPRDSSQNIIASSKCCPTSKIRVWSSKTPNLIGPFELCTSKQLKRMRNPKKLSS